MSKGSARRVLAAFDEPPAGRFDRRDRRVQLGSVLEPESEVVDAPGLPARSWSAGSALRVIVSRDPGVRTNTMWGPSRNISSTPNTC